MAQVLERLGNGRHGARWRSLTQVNWNPVLERWITWIDLLLDAHRPPGECEVLWFETPSVMQTSAMSVAGYARLGPAPDSYGLEDSCVWPSVRDGGQIEDWEFKLPELEELLADSRWTDVDAGADSDAAAQSAMSGALAISHACTLLLILNGLPKTKIRSFLTHASGVAAVMGWKSGDVIPIGQLHGKTWSPIRRARPKPLALAELSADERMVLAKYQPKRFVAIGGDLNEGDSNGETALMLSAHSTPAEIHALLEAGADASLRGPNNESILHRFGACEMETLRLLVKHGADPRALNNKGEPVTTRLVRDGRCSANHLKFYERLGVRLPPQGPRMSHAMACVATQSLIHDERGMRLQGMLRWIIARDHNINALDEQGRSPLWLALEQYAKTLNLYRSEPDNYRHDRTAELLLKFGSDPRVAHPKGVPPIIPRGAIPLMVRRYDDIRLVKALLRYGADPFARCSRGMTALEYAKIAAAEPQTRWNKSAAKCAALLELAMRKSRPNAPKRRNKLS